MIYKESDLILKVSKNINPDKWDEGRYSTFLDILFKKRNYQKEATEIALRYINSGEYNNLEELARENFNNNNVIRERFNNNINSFISDLGLPDKLSATIDLATGTGKSYVMYAIAIIMLAAKKVDRVLILAPSITIESELTKKFNELVIDDQLNSALGKEFIPPAIINGDKSIIKNSIAIENRDAIYSAQENRNSIIDSLSGNGENTLVLNDEVHHVFYSESNQWKKFIEDERNRDINFKYILGFTGTPYKRKTKTGEANDYFSDVVYRFSLKEAIEQGFVKDIEYIDKADMPNDANERWQVILNSHDKISEQLNSFTCYKPITIVVTSEKKRADSQAKKFKKFLKESRKITDEEVDKIVLCVHSGENVANDRLKLREVDQKDNTVEFIFSVSMLTEGWDVKRVFQIVPDEERAFNSKLLIAQVLGRGLRKPDDWLSAWGVPKVIVFNHEKWAPKVKSLVDELLDFKKSITLKVNSQSEYNFKLINIDYNPEEVAVNLTENIGTKNFLKDGYIKLPTDMQIGKANVELHDIRTNIRSNLETNYAREIFSINCIAQLMYDRFSDLPNLENKKIYEEKWPVEKLEDMIRLSLEKSSNKVITKKIKNAFINSMNVLFRDAPKSVSYETVPSVYKTIPTQSLPNVTVELSLLTKNKVFFYSEGFENSDLDDETKVSFEEIQDTTNNYRHQKIENKYFFKTPQLGIITTGEPEKNFVKYLVSDPIAKKINSFIKSPDMNFYHFNYTWRKGTYQQINQFNPDFFIKKNNLIIIVEIKDDSQIVQPDSENIGKYKASKSHFELLNKYFIEQNIDSFYKFTFLTPKNYITFFDRLVSDDNTDIINFNSELDVKLDNLYKKML